MSTINVRGFDTLGCTVLSTCLFQSLRERFPYSNITSYSIFPGLLQELNEIDKNIDAREKELDSYDIDLRDYLSRRPHNSFPCKHLSEHLIEYAENQLGANVNLRAGLSPKINFTEKELGEAQRIVESFSKTNPVIWLQTKSNSLNKDWPAEYWQDLLRRKDGEYSFIDLSNEKYEPRTSIAITKFCDAGITLDSFLLHGSKAAQAKNVIAILGSSRPEVVAYSDQTVLYEYGNCSVQPCGMHGYYPGCKPGNETSFQNHENSRCITDDYRCLKIIKPEAIIDKLDTIL